MAWSIFKKLLLIHLSLLSICSLTLSIEHQKRHVQQNRHIELQSTATLDTSKPERRVNLGLMGGHVNLKSTESSITNDDNRDDSLLLSAAGNGKDRKSGRDDDDEKKTLAQQVKEGKYGLIQNEIYPIKPKRPGIISYLSNPEVPRDNSKNLGGLNKEDIWLAENHILVLRGGRFPDHETEESTGDLQSWPPIDDYQAPKRQVRIPSQPQVPPPFPVQLTENGPIEILGTNQSLNHSLETRSQWIPEGLIPFNDTLNSDDNTTNPESPWNQRKNKSGLILGGVVGPFFPSLPPGAVFVPPPNNQSDYDDDDQSIYYPPPYSFKYSQDNSTAVPPGPLVPGIILPPPPDFFVQDEKKTTKTHSTKCSRCTTTPSPSSKSSNYSPQKSSTKSHKIATSSTKPPQRSFTMKPINKLKHKTVTVPLTESLTKSSEKTVSFMEITTPTPEKKLKLMQNYQIEAKTQERSRWTGGPNKSGPIVAYYKTTTPVYELPEITPVSLKNTITTEKRPESLASYYFYEEANDEVAGTTANPTVYFQETTQTPYYKTESLSRPPLRRKKPYYEIEITPSQQTAEDYSVEVIEPVVKTSPRYQYSSSESTGKITSTSRIQGQRMLSHSSPLYYQTVTERPQLNLETFFTTPVTRATKNDNRYDHEIKSRPVYQYSFEANNYSRGRQIYKQEVQVQPQKPVGFNEWQDIQDDGQLYDEYDEGRNVEQQQFKSKIPDNYETSTVRPSINTTPNPAHAYYTKQEEQLLDDVTREYFTNFGKKIRNSKLSSTTPIYGKNSVTERPIYPTRNSFVTNEYENNQASINYNKSPRVKVHYGDQSQRIYSLADDTQVNYQRPLPSINPDAEFLPGYEPNDADEHGQVQSQHLERSQYHQPNFQRQRLLPILRYDEEQTRSGPTNFVPLSGQRDNQRIYSEKPVSLAGDIAVNYRPPRPQINPDAEFIDPGLVQGENSRNPSSYFAYRLPGDGGHVYFLTPHAIAQRQETNGSFLRSRTSRPARRRRGPGNP